MHCCTDAASIPHAPQRCLCGLWHVILVLIVLLYVAFGTRSGSDPVAAAQLAAAVVAFVVTVTRVRVTGLRTALVRALDASAPRPA